MSTGQLRRGIFWRMCGWGVTAGLVCGAIYGTILNPIVATFLGGVTGAIAGLLLGIVTGLYLGAISLDRYNPLQDAEEYMRVATVDCTVVSVIVSGVIFGILTLPLLRDTTEGVWQEKITLVPLLPCLAIPTLIAAAATRWAARRTADWYAYNAPRARPRKPGGTGLDWEKK